MKTDFDERQFDLAYSDGAEHYWWQRAKDWMVAGLLRKHVRTDSPILDVGCGRGFTVAHLREMGFSGCRGVELAAIKPLSGLESFVKTGLPAGDLPSAERAAFRTLLLLDVIEHVPDPVPFLRQLAVDFPGVKSVVLNVPARQELWSNYDTFYGHHRRYSRPMMEDLCEKLGWKIRSMTYCFHSLYVPARILSALKKERSVKINAPAAESRGIHKLLGGFFVMEKMLLPRWIPGTSILAWVDLPNR
jgi:hypothetical protein